MNSLCPTATVCRPPPAARARAGNLHTFSPAPFSAIQLIWVHQPVSNAVIFAMFPQPLSRDCNTLFHRKAWAISQLCNGLLRTQRHIETECSGAVSCDNRFLINALPIQFQPRAIRESSDQEQQQCGNSSPVAGAARRQASPIAAAAGDC